MAANFFVVLIPRDRVKTLYRDYNRSLTLVGTFDVFVSTAAIFLESKPESGR